MEPADGATGVSVNAKIIIDFGGIVSGSSMVAQTSPGPCSGSVQVSSDGFITCIGFTSSSPVMAAGGSEARYTPAAPLASGSTYKIRVTTAVTDDYGNPIAAPYTSISGFTTI